MLVVYGGEEGCFSVRGGSIAPLSLCWKESSAEAGVCRKSSEETLGDDCSKGRVRCQCNGREEPKREGERERRERQSEWPTEPLDYRATPALPTCLLAWPCVLDVLRNCDLTSRNHDIAQKTSRASTQLLHCRWKGSRFIFPLLAQEEKLVLVGGTNHRRLPRHKGQNGSFVFGRRNAVSAFGLSAASLSLHCIVCVCVVTMVWRRIKL